VPLRPARPPLVVRLGLCGLAALAILLFAYVPIWIKGIDTVRVTRDPAAVAELPVYTGALSIAGVMAWSGMAATCLLAALILRAARAPRHETAFFAVSALALALLGADDALQIHENVLPDQFGVPQKLVYVVYLGAAAAWAWAFRQRLLWTDVVVLGLAGGLLAASVALDVVGEESIWLEDYFKFCGLAVGTGFWLVEARDAVLATRLRLDSDIP
jgi:hypothetical protein